MQKKAQGLSLNTIIVAIIVLIVLVVLIMIFTGYFGTRFTPQVTSCSSQGGDCVSEEECVTAFGEAIKPIRASDCTETEVCCIKGLGTGAPTEPPAEPPLRDPFQ